MKVVLTGGGTGGHIYPCLAVAEILRERGAELFYIGHQDKLEASIITERYPDSICFFGIKAPALPKSRNPFLLLFQLAIWIFDFALATHKAKCFLENNDIDVVFGTGGYVAAPVFAAAILTQTNYIIHNLDAHMGLANKMFIKDASALTLAFPTEVVAPENQNVLVTGNPVSDKFFEALTQVKKEPGAINILITGGSQGAQSINEAVAKILPRLIDKSKLSITHVTGAKLYDDFITKHLDGNPAKYPNYQVLAYTHEMSKLCAEADISICRSGAMTIAEMAASETVSIFVPLPWAANDHQTKNAQALVDAKAAIILRQDESSAEEFAEELLKKIYHLISDDKLLQEMKLKLRNFASRDTAKDLAQLVIKFGHETNVLISE